MADPSDDPALSGLVGPGVTWTGDLTFSGRVRIDGTFQGRIVSDDLVEIGPGGRVEGELLAPQVLVSGVVSGTLTCTERVTLLPTARVQGELVTPWLDVRMGAQLEGRVEVARAGGDTSEG